MFGACEPGNRIARFPRADGAGRSGDDGTIVSARTIAVSVRLARGRVEFRQDRGEPLPAALLCSVSVGRINGLLDERRVAHVEELARLVQLESRLADEPVGAKLDVGPCARRARLAAKLRGEALAVGLEAFGRLDAGKLGEGGIRIGKTHDVVEHLSRGRHGGPACDERDARSALQHAPLPAVDHAAMDGRWDNRRRCRCRRRR